MNLDLPNVTAWLKEGIKWCTSSKEDILRIDAANALNSDNIQLITDSSAYQKIHHILITSLPFFADVIVAEIISYLCYNKFYIGNECSLNIKTSLITFNIFDINARLCYIIQSQIINFDKFIQSISISTDTSVISLMFVGNINSCNMKHNSEFILQLSNHIFLCQWRVQHMNRNIKQTFIYFQTKLDINPGRNNVMMHNSTFFTISFIGYAFNRKTYKLIEIRNKKAIQYDYYRIQDPRFRMSFEPKHKVIKLFLNNRTFQSEINGIQHFCQHFLLDVCVWRNRFRPKYDRRPYINISAISNLNNELVCIGKFWFRDQAKKYITHWKRIHALKIINNRLFIVYSLRRKVFAGYFSISHHNKYENLDANIFYGLHCLKKVPLLFGGEALMGDIIVSKNRIKFNMKSSSSILEYLLSKKLKILDKWKIDKMENNGHWFGEYYAEYCVEIDQQNVLLKENDVELKKLMQYNQVKKNLLRGIGIASGIFLVGYGALFLLLTSISKELLDRMS